MSGLNKRDNSIMMFGFTLGIAVGFLIIALLVGSNPDFAIVPTAVITGITLGIVSFFNYQRIKK